MNEPTWEPPRVMLGDAVEVSSALGDDHWKVMTVTKISGNMIHGAVLHVTGGVAITPYQCRHITDPHLETTAGRNSVEKNDFMGVWRETERMAAINRLMDIRSMDELKDWLDQQQAASEAQREERDEELRRQLEKEEQSKKQRHEQFGENAPVKKRPGRPRKVTA